jgi:hypothetical protein
MPLTAFQKRVGLLLASNRSEDSYLAGGAAILSAPNSKRYSQDLDFFHDSSARVASAFADDSRALRENGFEIRPEINQPGYIKVLVQAQNERVKIEWAQDSSWRFMPVVKSEEFGYQLHPVDLATNKILALAGRDEARDILDTLYLHREVLGLGPLVWAASGKDPGFSPLSLLEMLKRRGRIHPEDILRLSLSEAPDIKKIKTEWLEVLSSAEKFIKSRPAEEAGCLYYSASLQTFVDPGKRGSGKTQIHYGRPGGVLPAVLDEE